MEILSFVRGWQRTKIGEPAKRIKVLRQPDLVVDGVAVVDTNDGVDIVYISAAGRAIGKTLSKEQAKIARKNWDSL